MSIIGTAIMCWVNTFIMKKKKLKKHPYPSYLCVCNFDIEN